MLFRSARAVAPLTEIVGWTRNLLKPHGFFALLKGGDLAQEVSAAEHDHPGLRVRVTPLRMNGVPWFEEQEKKIVVASFI